MDFLGLRALTILINSCWRRAVDVLVKSLRFQSRGRTDFLDGRGSAHAPDEFPRPARIAVSHEFQYAVI